MRRIRPLLLSALMCSAATSHAATLLATVAFSETHTLSSASVESTAIDLKFSYSLAPGGLTDLSSVIFDGHLFTAADVGQTFVLSLSDPSPAPGLAGFLARATNGIDDDLRDDAIGNNGGGVGLVAPESSRLIPAVPAPGPDLKAHTVTALELFIAELFIDPNAGSSLPHWHIGGELRFIGEASPVPLPAAWLSFASATALGGLALRRRAG